LKDVLGGFIIAIFQAGRESSDWLELKRTSEFPQRLRNRRSSCRGRGSKTHVGSGLVRCRALASDEASRIFENLSSQTEPPFLCEVMDQMGGSPSPPRILSGIVCAVFRLVGVVGFDHGRGVPGDLETENPASEK